MEIKHKNYLLIEDNKIRFGSIKQANENIEEAELFKSILLDAVSLSEFNISKDIPARYNETTVKVISRTFSLIDDLIEQANGIIDEANSFISEVGYLEGMKEDEE